MKEMKEEFYAADGTSAAFLGISAVFSAGAPH